MSCNTHHRLQRLICSLFCLGKSHCLEDNTKCRSSHAFVVIEECRMDWSSIRICRELRGIDTLEGTGWSTKPSSQICQIGLSQCFLFELLFNEYPVDWRWDHNAGCRSYVVCWTIDGFRTSFIHKLVRLFAWSIRMSANSHSFCLGSRIEHSTLDIHHFWPKQHCCFWRDASSGYVLFSIYRVKGVLPSRKNLGETTFCQPCQAWFSFPRTIFSPSWALGGLLDLLPYWNNSIFSKLAQTITTYTLKC